MNPKSFGGYSGNIGGLGSFTNELRRSEEDCNAKCAIQGVPERYPQVQQELDSYGKLLCVLQENINQLARRLAPLIPPMPEGNCGKECPPEPVLCEVAQRLKTNNKTLSQVADTIAALTQAVEV